MTISTAFSLNRVASGVAIDTQYAAVQAGTPAGRPIKIFVTGLAAADKTVLEEPYTFVSLTDTGTKFGYDSTLYQACKALKPDNAKGIDSTTEVVLYPCTVTTGVQAAGDVTPTGTAAKVEQYRVKVGSVYSNYITTEVGDTVADWIDKAVVACQGVIDFPMAATDGATTLDLEAGIESDTGDFYEIEIESPADPDFTFTYTQPTGGGGTVDVDSALSALGNTWYSHILNALSDVTDDTLLDKFEAVGELRRDPEVKKPLVAFTGTGEATLATVTAITDARTDDKTNRIKHNPDTVEFPWTIAGRILAIQTSIAAKDPAMDYNGATVSLLSVGADSAQLTSAQQNEAVTKGLSTVDTGSGSVKIVDAVGVYHPDGEDPPAYRWDVTIEKEAAMLNSINLIFSNPNDTGNPLAPNDQVTTNPNVRKPNYWQAKLNALYKGAAKAGIIADPDYAIENTQVIISDSNPNRVEALCVYKQTGNAKVFSVTQKFSFYVGGEA